MNVEDFDVDEYGTITIKRVGDDVVQVMPMIYNDRIVIADAPLSYRHGWCYDKGGAAILAALVWDPETEDAPAGYKKQAF